MVDIKILNLVLDPLKVYEYLAFRFGFVDKLFAIYLSIYSLKTFHRYSCKIINSNKMIKQPTF